MPLTTGQIDAALGNAIRAKIVDWCSTYKHPGGSNIRFYNVVVRINPVTAHEFSCAIRMSATYGGDVDKLLLQQDLLTMAETLRAESSILVDHVEITESGSVYMGFLGPDGERIPPHST